MDDQRHPLSNSLTTVPIQIKSEWNRPYQHYSLEFELSSEVPILVTILLKHADVLKYEKLWRSRAALHGRIRLSFLPNISFYQGGGYLKADGQSLLDPRQFVDTELASSATIYTGRLVRVATIRLSNPIVAQIIVLPKSDTEGVHGRWRIKRAASIDLPASLSFLAHGRCQGQISLS